MIAKLTAHDVARRANVSQSAVSRAFTEGASVAPATKARILAAANELGYRPTSAAKSAAAKSRVIGLVTSGLANPFNALVIEKLSLSLAEEGYRVLLFVTEGDDSDLFLPDMLDHPLDGVILAAAASSSSLARHCADAGMPVVLFNRVADVDGAGRFLTGSVSSDNLGGGRHVAELLIQRGHRRIAYLAGIESSSTTQSREAGLRQALREASIDLHARIVGNYKVEDTQAAIRALFQAAAALPDAIFAANDHMAMTAIDTIRSEFHLRVPEDISVVGFDDVPQAGWPSHSLTTVRQDIDAMVAATKALLFGQIMGETCPAQVCVPCTIVDRRSVGIRGASVHEESPATSLTRQHP